MTTLRIIDEFHKVPTQAIEQTAKEFSAIKAAPLNFSFDYNKPMVEYATRLIHHFHHEQVDRAGEPYLSHLRIVAYNAIIECAGADEETLANIYVTALLHDILEDTPCTISELRNPQTLFDDLDETYAIPENVITAMLLLTKNPKNYNRHAYFKGIRENELARKVKIADLLHNSQLSRLSPSIKLHDIQRTKNYLDELSFLIDKSASSSILNNDL